MSTSNDDRLCFLVGDGGKSFYALSYDLSALNFGCLSCLLISYYYKYFLFCFEKPLSLRTFLSFSFVIYYNFLAVSLSFTSEFLKLTASWPNELFL